MVVILLKISTGKGCLLFKKQNKQAPKPRHFLQGKTAWIFTGETNILKWNDDFYFPVLK